MNNHDGNEANSPSSRRIFVAKVRKFVMENNVELRVSWNFEAQSEQFKSRLLHFLHLQGLYSSTTQPAIGLSFLCTLLDVAKTLWEEECDHERGLDGKTVPPTIDCRFFYDGTFKYSNLDRIGGVLSYLRKHFRTQLIERLGADHPSLASVDQPSDLRSEIGKRRCPIGIKIHTLGLKFGQSKKETSNLNQTVLFVFRLRFLTTPADSCTCKLQNPPEGSDSERLFRNRGHRGYRKLQRVHHYLRSLIHVFVTRRNEYIQSNRVIMYKTDGGHWLFMLKRV